MDFGVLSHREASSTATIQGSTEPKNDKANGSGNLKDKRSELAEDSWWVTKMPRPSQAEIPSNKTENLIAFGRSNIWSLGGDDGQKMLSFSSSEPHCQNENYTRTRGGLNEGMRMPFARLKGPFTPCQWMELERQALIYKYILGNVPIHSNLLAPLTSPLYPYASSGSHSSNFLGWGPFHLGFSGSNDPEPGRCRRTDGKKWRCSRDAVPDQKYCERHINRGRHRSRKPVEGQTGHVVTGSTASSVPSIASSSALVSSSLGTMQHKPNSLQHNTVNLVNRKQGFQDLTLIHRKQGFEDLTVIPPTTSLNAKDVPFSAHKKHVPFEDSLNSEFGIVYSDALVNPLQRISYLNSKDSGSLLGFNDQDATDQCSVRHFNEVCPKDQSHQAPISWPEELKSDWTQLSMSIPGAPDFSSSPYPSLLEKPTISTERLSHELDPIQMSLGLCNDIGESLQRQLNWIPVSWGNSIGGPLGEVLTSTTVSVEAGMTSPQLDSSPKGVLHKSTFVSLSNGSTGSSHIADHKRAPENGREFPNI